MQRFNVLVCHRRMGKTVLGVNKVSLGALQLELERPRFAYIAPLLKQAKAVAWDYLKHYNSVIPGVKFNESELRVDMPNGGRVTVLGADNPDSLRGIYLDGVVMDEVAQMDPTVWEEVVRPTLSDRKGWVLFIGTPKGRNMFYDLYNYALEDPTWYAGMFRASETGLIDEQELEEARKTMSESKYMQEYECSFNFSGEDLLVPLEWILAATRREVPGESSGRRIAGLDVARFGQDKTALVIRTGDVINFAQQWQGRDTMQTTGKVKRMYDRGAFDHIYIDVIGIGSGVVDRLGELGVPSTGINVSEASSLSPNTFKLRDDLWWRVRNWFESQKAVIPESLALKEQIVNEISGVWYKEMSTGRIKVASKEEMRRREDLPSPNLGDAVCLTMADVTAGGGVGGGFSPKRSGSKWWR